MAAEAQTTECHQNGTTWQGQLGMKTSRTSSEKISTCLLSQKPGCKLGQCDRHGQYKQYEVIGPEGKKILSSCPQCDREEELADRQREAEKREKTQQAVKFGKTKLPKRFQNRFFAGYKLTQSGGEGQSKAFQICTRYAANFKASRAKGTCLTFCGSPGTGKTHLAAAICNEIVRQGWTARFTRAYQFLRAVKSTYNRNAERSEQEIMDEHIAADLLVLDEVGVQFGTRTEQMILFELINARYDEVKPTIIISNSSVAELEEFMGAAAMDRLKEGGGVVLGFDWQSYRR